MNIGKSIIYFASSNPNKLLEFNNLIGNRLPHIQFQHFPINLPELQADSLSVAIAKCREAAMHKTPIIVEDASLCFHAWNGMPGPYIKSFIEKMGCDLIYNSLRSFEDKQADALCIYAYQHSLQSEPITFVGKAEGTIVKPRGNKNFSKKIGWDSLFQPLGNHKTYGEMEEHEKNANSHRSKAIEQLIRFLLKR